MYIVNNATLPATRRPARRFVPCSTAEGCAQLRSFPTTGKFNLDGTRIAAPLLPASCALWENDRTAAAVNLVG